MTGRLPTFEDLSGSLAHHETFLVFAETLEGWRSPVTPEGRATLGRHYQWLARHRASGALLFAGPVDVESLGPGTPPPVGRVTGILVFRAASRSEAQAIAQNDPFHLAEFRKNHVHSWSIRFIQPELEAALRTTLSRNP